MSCSHNDGMSKENFSDFPVFLSVMTAFSTRNEKTISSFLSSLRLNTCDAFGELKRAVSGTMCGRVVQGGLWHILGKGEIANLG